MPYVMVPVPEEHVEDVMQFILRAINRASMQPWDAAAITQAFDEMDEPSRSLLAFVARATLAGESLTDADAARQIQMTVRETAGITNELSRLAQDENRPGLIHHRRVEERLPNNRTTDKRVLAMDLDVAELIVAAERADALRAKPPAPGTAD